MTVTLAVFWLSGSAAWANGLNGLKGATHGIINTSQCRDVCTHVAVGSVTELTISVVSHVVMLHCIACFLPISFYCHMKRD
jgi:hypothetical protein